MNFKLHNIKETLRLESDQSTFLKYLWENYRHRIRTAFEERVKNLEVERKKQILSLWAQLSEAQQDSLLENPLLSQTLYPYHPFNSKLWNTALQAELKISSSNEETWTIDGLYKILPTGLKKRSNSLKLECGIVVDYASPYALEVDDHMSYKDFCFRLSDSQAQKSFSKIEEAMELMKEHCPEAYTFSVLLTKNIYLYGVNGDERFGSSSMGPKIGLCILRNPHLELVTPGQIAESIFHEAIHFFLCLFELDEAFILDRTAVNERFAVSPWTGNRIDAHSLIHACFVWASLWRFWQRIGAKTTKLPLKKEALNSVAKTGFGFATGISPLAQYKLIESALHQGILELIHELTLEIYATELAKNPYYQKWRQLA